MRRSQGCVAAVFALVLTVAAQGEMITFAFSGTITIVDQGPAKPIGDVKVNDVYHGTVTFDPWTLDSDPASGRGRYNSPAAGLSITIGELALEIPGPNMTIQVNDGPTYAGSAYDSFSVGGLRFTSAGLSISEFSLSSTLDNSAFNSEALPLVPPDPDLFLTGQIVFFGSKPGVGEFGIYGTFDSLSLVPEPGSLLLLVCGCVLASCRKSRPRACPLPLVCSAAASRLI